MFERTQAFYCNLKYPKADPLDEDLFKVGFHDSYLSLSLGESSEKYRLIKNKLKKTN